MVTKPRLLLLIAIVTACVIAAALLLLVPPGPSRTVAAARDGDASRIAALLAKGADPDAVLTESSLDALLFAGKLRLRTTPLIEAVRHDHAEVVRLLLDAGGDPEFVPDADALSPLFTAVQRASPDVISMLVEAGASIRRPVPVDGRPVFVWAAAKPGSLPRLVRLARAIDPARDEAMIREAMKLRARATRRSKTARNPLIDRYLAELLRQIAATPDDTLVRIRLADDPSIAAAPSKVRPDSEWTVLTWAIINERTEIVDALLSTQAGASDATALGMTPLMAAAAVGDAALVERLLSLGYSVEATDELGATPADHAAAARHEAIAARLR